MQNCLHEISYIACGLIHFYKELAIERSLLNHVGCVITWVTWVRGSNFYVGYEGQNIFTWVIIFAWVKYIFVGAFEWVQIFCVGFCLLRESAFFTS